MSTKLIEFKYIKKVQNAKHNGLILLKSNFLTKYRQNQYR